MTGLGTAATISSVLYSNINHPEWKSEYPDWSDRCKQILKKWRALPSDKKTPYLKQARDNRGAIRMKRARQVRYLWIFSYVYSIVASLYNKQTNKQVLFSLCIYLAFSESNRFHCYILKYSQNLYSYTKIYISKYTYYYQMFIKQNNLHPFECVCFFF